ncbi:MAG: flagellar hook capping FlgD N-terminal domain-containing protein [Pseudomonadota bacterium]
MDPIVQTNAVPYGQPQVVRAPTEDDGTAITSDFETFLTMLTTQLENQDPLNPQESTEFATQLAQFSSVEQAVQTNDLLTDLLGATSAAGLADMAAWVGMEARTTAPRTFDGAPLEIEPPVIPFANTAQLVVFDAAGAEVQRVNIDNDGKTLDWVGVNEAGEIFPNGTYSFEVQGFSEGTLIGSEPIPHYGLVVEVQLTDAGPNLKLADGATLPASSVSAVREVPADG